MQSVLQRALPMLCTQSCFLQIRQECRAFSMEVVQALFHKRGPRMRTILVPVQAAHHKEHVNSPHYVKSHM